MWHSRQILQTNYIISDPYAQFTLSAVGQRADDPVQQKDSTGTFGNSSKAEAIIHEKLNEEIFGRIAKNLKWVRVMHGMALRSLSTSRGRRGRTDTKIKSDYSEMVFLLERIHTAEQCFSTTFTPVLNGLYPEKYESTELYGKYIIALYELAKYTRSIQMVTEELWEETLPEGNAENDYIASGKRVIEGLSPASSDGDDAEKCNDEFLSYVRNLHLAVTNLSANFDQLKGRFQDNREIGHLCSFLKPRIGQIENASTMLYRFAKSTVRADKQKGDTNSIDVTKDRTDLPKEQTPQRPSLSRQLHNLDANESHLNHQRVVPESIGARTKKAKKWTWNGQVELGRIELKKSKAISNSSS
jgi:hypothetical protein